MSPSPWRRALRSDIPALSDFLSKQEERRVGFSGRILREGALRLPSTLRGAVWIHEDSSSARKASAALSGALLCHPSRLVFPIFPPEREDDAFLALLVGPFSPASTIGMREDIVRYESCLRLASRARVDYRLMTFAPGPGFAPHPALAYPGLSVRRALISDLDALMPLQEGYEREEVLTPIHEFNWAACKASLARSLERQLVFVAEEGGVIVGKAGTNARGFGVDQVGGVYTLPARRGRGVASALVSALMGEIGASGRRIALFVKPTNASAYALYRGLGFDEIGDYRADYFEA
jgi:ribosomal protein S18 acetylase RimI-like enzyme